MSIVLKFKKFSKKYSRKNLYELLNYEVDTINKNKIILNVGAGGDVQSRLDLLKSDNKIISIDVDKSRNPDFVMDVLKLDFEDNFFDYVFLIEVLEHVKNPFIALSEINRVLKKGGKLIMSTPFMLPIHDAPNDFFRYTKYGIELLTSKFINVEIKERNTYINSIFVIALRMIFSKNKKLKLIGLIFFPFFILQYHFFSIISYGKSDYSTTGYFTTCFKK